MKVSIFALLICFLVVFPMHAIIKGSESGASVEPYFDFPATDTDNTIIGFAWCKHGFGFEDATTSGTFNAVYPVSGTINLRGGTLYLESDLTFCNATELEGLGKIYGNGHAVVLCNSIDELPIDTALLKDVHLIFAHDLDLLGTITIQGTCIIDGNNSMLDLDEGGRLIIDHGATLELRNMLLEGVADNIFCVDDTAHLILDGLTWCQMGNLTFDHGDIMFQRRVDFLGSATFVYSSPMTSTIDDESIWSIGGGMSLLIGKNAVDSQEPLYFHDEESIITFGECSLTLTATLRRY